ncbi:MAG: hypothetical protein JRC86_09350 [Deltaproteobacteria bacterium]|nr:hypothetical protein [Deltaproteobacteria bacterium]
MSKQVRVALWHSDADMGAVFSFDTEAEARAFCEGGTAADDLVHRDGPDSYCEFDQSCIDQLIKERKWYPEVYEFLKGEGFPLPD